MNDAIKKELLRVRKKAEASVARVPEAEAHEEARAALELREPNPVQPLTEVMADSLAAAIASIKGEVSSEAGELIAIHRRSTARSAGRKVAMRSDHLLVLLEAAGIKGDPKGAVNAEVQG